MGMQASLLVCCQSRKILGTNSEIGVDGQVDEGEDEGFGQNAASQRPDTTVAFGGYTPLCVLPLLGVCRSLGYSVRTSARSSDQGISILRSEVTTATSQLYKVIYPSCVLTYL